MVSLNTCVSYYSNMVLILKKFFFCEYNHDHDTIITNLSLAYPIANIFFTEAFQMKLPVAV